MDANSSRSRRHSPYVCCRISGILALLLGFFLIEERATDINRGQQEIGRWSILRQWGRGRSNHDDDENKLKSSTPSISCRRQCQTYNNRIIYKNGGAGIDDRLEAMHGMTNLAAFLCAKLVVPPPHEWLGVSHNGRHSVSSNLTWAHDFATYYLLSNGEEAIIEESKKVHKHEESAVERTDHQPTQKITGLGAGHCRIRRSLQILLGPLPVYDSLEQNICMDLDRTQLLGLHL